MNERLIELREQMGAEWFTAVFFEWMNNHDDSDITCMSDVVSTLVDDCEEDMTYAR